MRLIDADELLTAFPTGDEPTVTIACIRATIEHMPTIEERKTGEWILLDKDNVFFTPHMVKCPFCGNILDRLGVNAGRGDANFCPNCGADMRGV